MRRFELVDGSSSKFWQIEREGSKLTIQWGKIGTAGQSQVKDFPSDAKALAERDKLVTEKTKKGYAEVGAPAADAPAPKPRAAKAKADKTSDDPAATTATPHAEAKVETIESTVSVAKVEPVAIAGSGPVEIDWSRFGDDKDVSTHRHGRRRPNEAQRAADAWEHIQKLWSTWRPIVAFDKFDIAAEFVPAATEAHAWLEGKGPGPLSPMAAAMVAELASVSYQPEFYPAIRAFTEASVAKYGVGWIFDTVLAATRVYMERYSDPPSCKFHHVPESIGPFSYGGWMPQELALIAQNLSEAQYAELIQIAEMRWPMWSYFQRLRTLEVIPSHTKLADDLGEQWLSCDGNVEGYVRPSYDKDGIAPNLSFAYSRSMLTKLAKKSANRAFSGGSLHQYVWKQLELVGADVLPMLRIHCDSVDWAAGIVAALEAASLVRSTETGALMVSQLTAKKEGALYAAEWIVKNPLLSVAALADSIAGAGAIGDRAGVLFLDIDRAFPGLVDKIDMRPAARSAITKLREKMVVKPDASADELPRVLANPPWLSGKNAAALPVVANVAVAAYAEKIHEDPDGILALARSEYAEAKESRTTYEDASRNIGERYYGKWVSRSLVHLEPADVKKAFKEWPADAWGDGHNVLTPLVVMGEEAIAGYPRIVTGNSTMFAASLKHIVESPKLAGFYAYARTLKGARKYAERWMLNFPKAAAVGLIPIAVGNHTQARAQADMALRLLVARGHGEVVREAAEGYGKEVDAALKTALEADPRDRYPSKLPKIGPWCDVEKLPRPLLKGREKSLPKPAVEALIMMLAISTPEAAYVGLEDVVAVCDRSSLEEFSWALFNQWQMAGAPSDLHT